MPIMWLPKGYIVGGGDVGIPLWRPQNALRVQSYSWIDTNATGNTYPNVFTAEPFYLIFSVIDKLGISADISQKILFFTILFGSSISIFFLSKHFFISKKIAFVAAFFYIFNLTSLSVWQRGVHNGMLMLLLAPLSLLILVKGISTQKYVSILWINIVSFLLSYVFGALGFVFSLWLLWTIYLLIVLCKEWTDKSKRKFILTYYFILVISWIGTNAWWIVHLLASSNYALGQFTQEELKTKGSDVLMGLKPYHEASYIFRGLSRYIHYVVKDWGEIYSSAMFIILSWIPTLIVFSTTLIRKNYRSPHWRFLIILLLVVLVISKGVNPPLGFLNKVPYDFFPFLAPLRNPYEKVGILLAIPFSLLFALGIRQICGILKSKKIGYFIPIFLMIAIACLTVLVWPLWLGKLFISEGRKYVATIPSYYEEANNWLKERVLAEDTRILHLPLSWGESIDYNWGYTGIEPSQYFFNGSSIGYQIGVSSVDLRIRDIIISIHNQDSISVQKAIASLNVGWVIVHNETVWRPRILESPERINTWLSTKPDFLEYVIDFGPLSIFRVKDQYRLGHFYSTDKLINVSNLKPQASLNIWNKVSEINDSFITETPDNYKSLLNKFVSENIIIPTKSSVYTPLPTINEETALNNLATVSFLPDSLFYPLVILKENILSFINQDDTVTNCFILSGKRLKEAVLLARQNKFTETNKSLISYEKQLGKCSKINNGTVIAYMGGNLADLTLGQLIKQKAVLNAEFKSIHIIKEGENAKTKLIEYLSNLGLAPRFDSQKVDNTKQRIIFNYSVTEEGNYKIKLQRSDQTLMKNPPKIVSIDGQLVDLAPDSAYKFSQGFHEIQLEREPNENLLDTQLKVKKSNPDLGFTSEVDPTTQKNIFTGKVSSGFRYLAFDFLNLDVEQNYELNFDLFLNQGVPPFVTITHDSDPIDPQGNYIPAVKGQVLYASDLPDGWKHVKIGYLPILNSTMAKFSLIITPPTEIKFRNITLTKTSVNDLVLEKINNVSIQKMEKADTVWKKIDPTAYEVTISSQKPPYILVFSETFHPLWQVSDSTGTVINLPHVSINGYANAWLVENPLPEKIKVKFILQNARIGGILISIISALLMIGTILYLDHKRMSNV